MPNHELDSNDPNIAFGQEQGLFTYNMASSLTGGTNATVAERAEDAVKTAVRSFDRPEIDVEIATTGLIAALEGDFNARQ